MKTVLIAASPKKKWSNTAYLLTFTSWAIRGEQVWIDFRGPKDYPRILSALQDADALVFGMPLYVDAVPSHVLLLLQEIERFTAKNQLHLRVYSVCNCGFYEGIQCELELAVLACWCQRAGLTFCGGVGIGAGEMIGMLRLNLLIGAIVMLLVFLVQLLVQAFSGPISAADVLSCLHPMIFLIFLLVTVLFSLGPWLAAIKVGRSVSARRCHPIRYTTVSCCPAFLFVVFADIYWVIRAGLLHLVPVWRLFRRV